MSQTNYQSSPSKISLTDEDLNYEESDRDLAASLFFRFQQPLQSPNRNNREKSEDHFDIDLPRYQQQLSVGTHNQPGTLKLPSIQTLFGKNLTLLCDITIIDYLVKLDLQRAAMQNIFAAKKRPHSGHSHTYSVPMNINYYNQHPRYEREDCRGFSTPSAFPYVSMSTHAEPISHGREISHHESHSISLRPSGPMPNSSQRTRTCANCGTQDTPSWRRCGPGQTVVGSFLGCKYILHGCALEIQFD